MGGGWWWVFVQRPEQLSLQDEQSRAEQSARRSLSILSQTSQSTDLTLKTTLTLKVDQVVLWVEECLCVDVAGELSVLQDLADVVLQLLLSLQDEVPV